LEPRRRIYIIIASILLHILLFFLLEGALRFNLINFDVVSEAFLDDESIVFDLQQPERPREVIETPEDAKVVERQEKAEFLSDKNALARNQEINPDLNVGEAFSRGITDSHDLSAKQGVRSNKPQKPMSEKEVIENGEGEEESPKVPKEDMDTEGDMIAYKLPERKRPDRIFQKEPGPHPGVTHDNRDSRARDMGGLAFNTYDWNFAPYMLFLKKKIGNNIFPPAKFYLGMMVGENLLRFRIYPDGELKGLELLGYEGHQLLTKTSHNAVDASAPFPQLPQNFPKPYLEVTVRFTYIFQKGNR